MVTSYKNPDLDGVASAIAYTEFLQTQGEGALVAIFGTPHKEAQFVLHKFNISNPTGIEGIIVRDSQIVFVDASDIESLPTGISTDQVVEIVDHRQFNNTSKFRNAKIQLELVGACATLVAEKFYDTKKEISKESAVLLYGAIVSNTLNFKGSVTTERDIKMAEWLKNQVPIPKNFEYDMFVHKSNLDQPIREVLLSDFKIFDLGSKKVSIAQLEILDTNDYLKNNLVEIKRVLQEIKEERQLDYLFLNFVDLNKGINIFVAADQGTQELISQVLGIKFENSIACSDKMLLRKQIYPLIKNVLHQE